MDLRSIDSENPDYYMWGRNCKILNLEKSDIDIMLEPESGKITSEQYDLFWEGYHYGLENIPDLT